MEKHTDPTPRTCSIEKAAERIASMLRKKLADRSHYRPTTEKLLRTADTLVSTANMIYSAFHKPVYIRQSTEDTLREEIDRIRNDMTDLSIRCDMAESRTVETTSERIITITDRTTEKISEERAETYSGQFVRSFGNRIFEAQKNTGSGEYMYSCINELLQMLNAYYYKRFRQQFRKIGVYNYSVEQIPGFIYTIILKYAIEYSHCPQNAKAFVSSMNEWLDRIGTDKDVTLHDSLPRCLHTFSIEQDVEINETVIYIWWLLIDELRKAKRTKNETLDFDDLFDYEYIDELAEKYNPEAYNRCIYPPKYSDVAKYLE